MSAKAKSKLTPEQRNATLRRVLEKIRPYGFFVVCSLIVAAVSVAAQLYIPILCGSAIDMMLGKGNVDFNGVLRIVVEIVIVAVVAAFAQWLLSVCNNRITFSVSRDLRNAALRKIQTLPLSYLDSHPSGDIVSRMVADVDTFADGLLMGFTQLFSGVLTILGTLLFMLGENVPITLVVVCITPLSLVVASFLAKRSYKYFQGQSTVRGEQTALVNEMIEGQKVVQAFGHEAESLASFDEVNARLQDVSLKAIFFSSMTNPATRFVNNIVYAGVGLVGALYAVRGGITIGQLSVFLSYANQYTKPFNEISGVVTELQNALACAARVFELLDAEDQVPEAENAAVLQPDGHVQLQDVSFRYLPDRPLIEGLSLDVQPGQRIAIVGPTGCGKTTLINLLMRFYDVNSGSIKVSSTDIRDVTRASLRGSYGMVLQDTWLRAGTVRENIAYGKPDATMDEVIAAAKAAHAHSFIRRLPDGYGQRMLRGLFHRGSHLQQFHLSDTDRDNVCDPGPALCNSASLVQHHGLGLAQHFQALGGFNEDAALSGLARAHHNGHWCRQAQCTGAGDYQHRDTNGQAEADTLAPRKVPQQRRRQSNTDNHRHEHGADAVRQPGDGRLGGGRLLHEPHDLRKGGIAAYPPSLQLQIAGEHHRCR